MEVAKRLGDEIKNIRTDILNTTQKNIAESLDISIVYMSYIEKGKKIPSKEFLDKLYKLAGNQCVPENILSMLEEAKKQRKRDNFINTPSNIVQSLEEQGLHSYTKLKTLMKKNVYSLPIINSILTLLVHEGKIDEAKKHLLESLVKIENPEHRKWIEASYYELEGNFPFAIKLMNDAINEFDKRFVNPNKEELNTKIKLLFQIACIYFRYGQHLYYNDDRKECVHCFLEALKYHKILSELTDNPSYKMDYSGVFFWLAILNVNPEENWSKYISLAKEALIYNYYSGVETFDLKRWKSLYSKYYIIATVSFLVRAYAQLAEYKSLIERDKLLNEGEFLLALYTPINISNNSTAYYRYYFNKACFYSIKAQLTNSEKEKNDYLNITYLILQEAHKVKYKNKINIIISDLKNSIGIKFFRDQRYELYNLLIQNLNNF